MQLAIWTYEGPPHVGAMRIASSMRGVHLVLHAPQGDTYADLLFTMIERRDSRPPVTYTTFQARDLGADTADLFKRSCRAAAERFQPEALLVAASCTAELLQDDPGGLAATLGLDIPVVPLELPSYSRKENWGAAETFLALVRRFAPAPPRGTAPREMRPAGRRVCNILGPTALGFRHRDDIVEVRLLLERMGVAVNVIAPLGAAPSDLARLPEADFNIVLYPETGQSSADWLKRSHGQPFIAIPPIGVGATRRFLAAVAEMAGVPVPAMGADLRLPWYSRSVDSTYLTGKRVFIFGDATHVVAAARIARDELGFAVAGIGTYSREFARDVRAMAAELGLEALITDDHLDVEDAIAACHPELVLGTQMERHVAKRLGVPCAVISAPVHVQDFPARRAPQMGEEGANVIFDSWVHPLMMGLEEHLLGMFRDDFEFADGALPSHLGRAGGHLSAVPAAPVAPIAAPAAVPAAVATHQAPAAAVAVAVAPQFIPSPIPVQHGAAAPAAIADPAAVAWSPEAEKELRKIPFFVRGKARRNTERYAVDRGLATITLETLYDAKAHYAR